MATATSSGSERRTRRAIRPAAAAVMIGVLVVVAVVVASGSGSPRTAAPRGAFSWLRPAAAPAGWQHATTPSGASVAFPPGWHTIRTDAGTISAAPRGSAGVFGGYLNATPQSGPETLANWRSFRVAHVAGEGARRVRLEASASGLRFATGQGSCVIDSYSTSAARFREIACIVAGSHTTVIVAAAPVARWAQVAPQLERAVASFRA